MSAPRLLPGTGATPTLTPGRDPMPTACSSCGSTMLGHAPAHGGDLFGTVTCAMCGRTLAYLRPSARPVPLRPEQVVPPPNTTSAEPVSPPPAESLPSTASTAPHARTEQDWRRADCDERCVRVRALLVGSYAVGRYHPQWVEAHDPDAHARHRAELMAALVALCTAPIAPWDVVVGTGPLAVDLAEHRCMVDGRLVRLAPTETRLLEHFARRLGRTCTVAGVTADVWPDYGDGDDRRFRVTLSRVLDRLGAARRLLVHRHGYGYLLLDEPYTGPVDFPSLRPPPLPPWAKAHARCVDCGTTERRHQGHGLCSRCRYRRTPREKRHPGRKRKERPT
ncbi:MAG: winged helix-turn-helix domain-containing protein [Chloroflexota bacterium]